MAVDRFRENPRIQQRPKNDQEWASWVLELNRWIASQVSVDAAQNYTLGSPGFFTWHSDSDGVWPADDPTENLTLTFYSGSGTVLAARVMAGQLNSTSGNITVTEVSTVGATTTYTLVGDGGSNPKVNIVLTNSDGSETVGTIAWTATDNSVAGGIPVTGGGK